MPGFKFLPWIGKVGSWFKVFRIFDKFIYHITGPWRGNLIIVGGNSFFFNNFFGQLKSRQVLCLGLESLCAFLHKVLQWNQCWCCIFVMWVKYLTRILFHSLKNMSYNFTNNSSAYTLSFGRSEQCSFFLTQWSSPTSSSVFSVKNVLTLKPLHGLSIIKKISYSIILLNTLSLGLLRRCLLWNCEKCVDHGIES